MLLKGVELSRSSCSRHGSSLVRRDTVLLRHGGRDAIALGKAHLLVYGARPALRLLVMLLRRDDG